MLLLIKIKMKAIVNKLLSTCIIQEIGIKIKLIAFFIVILHFFIQKERESAFGEFPSLDSLVVRFSGRLGDIAIS